MWFWKAFGISIFASTVIFVFELPFVRALELHLSYKWSTRIIVSHLIAVALKPSLVLCCLNEVN